MLTLPDYLLGMSLPLIGITTDLVESPRPAAQCAMAYARCVSEAGGLPVLLPPIVELATAHAEMCEGFVFTGGGDVWMEKFGEAILDDRTKQFFLPDLRLTNNDEH